MRFIGWLDSDDLDDIYEAILQQIDYHLEDVRALPICQSHHYADGTNLEMVAQSMSFGGGAFANDLFVLEVAQEQITIKVKVRLNITAFANFSLYVRDTIDYEDIWIGDEFVERELRLDAAVVLQLNSPNIFEVQEFEDIEIEVTALELANGVREIDFGFVDFNDGNPEEHYY